MNRYTLSVAALTAIFLSGGVGAASYDPALSDPLVVAPSGIWREVLPDMRTVPIFEPRDPGPCGPSGNRPCVGGGGSVDYTDRPRKGDSVIVWVVRPVFPGNGGGLVDNPACDKAQGRPPFCDNVVVHPPVDPHTPPIPLPGAVWGLAAALGALSYMKWKRHAKV